MSTTIRMYLSREGLALALQTPNVPIRSIRVIRKDQVFVTDFEGLLGLDLARRLEETSGAVVENPDVAKGEQVPE